MKHLSGEQLVLYYYDEGEERPVVREHLASCELCRKDFEALERVLGAVEQMPLPERSANYETEVWRRVQPRLADQMPRRVTVLPHRSTFLRWGAVAAMIVMAFLAGRFWSGDKRPAIVTINAQGRQRILQAALGDHLERSQMVLIELLNSDDKQPVDITSEQQMAEDLIDENRLYRQTAAGSGDSNLIVLLDELERVLMEIAHSPSTLDAAALAKLRQRIETEGILFKVRVIGSGIRTRST
jgi:hypothetical protein